MKIEKQICSIEQAKRLKMLGVIQESAFYYVNNWKSPTGKDIANGQHIIQSREKHLTRLAGRKRGAEVEFVSAYTSVELGMLLPHILPSEELEYGNVLMQSFPDGKEQDCYLAHYIEVYSDLDYGGVLHSYSASSEAVSRAGLLLDLIEGGVIKTDNINEKYCPKSTDIEIF